MAKEKTTRFDGRVDITVLCKRHRLTDPDDKGGSAKYLIDAIVSRGLLADDSAKEIRRFEKDQEKVGTKEKEETIVTIKEVVNGTD